MLPGGLRGRSRSQRVKIRSHLANVLTANQPFAIEGVQNIHSLSVLRLIFKPLQKEVCRNIHSLSRQDASGGLSEQVTIPTCENSLTPCERLDCKSALCARRSAEYSFLERTAIDCQNLAERGVSEYSFLERAAL